MSRLVSLLLAVVGLAVVPSMGMCPAQCQCDNRTVTCKGQKQISSPDWLHQLDSLQGVSPRHLCDEIYQSLVFTISSEEEEGEGVHCIVQ